MIKNNFDKNQIFLVTGKALPKILISVLKAKHLVETNNINVSKAVKLAGVSRTSYYKYCNDVFYYDDNSNSKIYTLEILNEDRVGNLSKITDTISKYKFNILTINQDQPIKGFSKIVVSIVMTDNKYSISNLIESIKKIKNIKEVKLLK